MCVIWEMKEKEGGRSRVEIEAKDFSSRLNGL